MNGKILILGGGFGGIRTALDLAKTLRGMAEIILVERNGYHLFIPALYEAASIYKIREDPFAVTLRKTVAMPLSDIFRNTGVRVVQGEVSGMDLNKQEVTLTSGHVLTYDYLVIALGSVAANFGIPGASEYAFQFKGIDDAILIHRHLRNFFTCAAGGTKKPPIQISIVGGGLTGIELAAELALTARKTAEECGVAGVPAKVELFEAASQVLPQLAEKERQIIIKRMNSLGVSVVTNSKIEAILDGEITLSSGKKIQSDLVIWSAGIVACPLLRLVENLKLTERGKIVVDEYLRALGHRNVFAVGDNIEFMDHTRQRPIPALAYLAVDHGVIAAQNIFNSIEGKELVPHKPFYDVWIAPIGGKWAVARLWKGIIITGFLGWVIRELVDLKYFLSVLPWHKALKLFYTEIRFFTRND